MSGAITRRILPAPSNAAPPVLRQTFLAKARQDHAACDREARAAFVTRDSRMAMVNLLGRAIQNAAEKNYDDELLVTYRNIDTLIRGWYFEGPIQSIISATLFEAEGGMLDRQLAERTVLTQENQRLTRAFDALDRAHSALELVHRRLEEFSQQQAEVLRITQATLVNASLEVVQLRSELATEKAEKTQLQHALVKSKRTAPSPKGGTVLSESKVMAEPGFF